MNSDRTPEYGLDGSSTFTDVSNDYLQFNPRKAWWLGMDLLSRTDNYYTFDIGAKYFIIPQVFIGPRYIHETRNSETAGFDYRDNRYLLTLGGQL